MSDGTNVIDRLYDAMASGDIDAARDCFTPDAKIWHCFDRIVQDRDAMLKDWKGMFSTFSERQVHDVRRVTTPTGFFQTHVFVAGRNGAPRMAWPICIAVNIEDGRIARLDEYIDRAGSFVPNDGMVTTPGF